MPSAAFFDLDGTLVDGAVEPVFRRHLRRVGVLSGPHLPGADAAQELSARFGDTVVVAQLARVGARSARGWAVDAVAEAADAAAAELAGQLLPYARVEIDGHRDAGRRVVLAAPAPAVLVRALAERIGADDVIAVEWATGDGSYAGRAAGRIPWGRGKLAAVRAWAATHGVDLRSSHAYSDSASDVPLLRGVGSPVAVAPDPALAAVATLNGWPVRHFDVPEGVVKVAGRELQEWFRPLNRPELSPNARFDISGTGHIPAEGPTIVVFNHRSYFDSAAVNFTLARAGRPARFLGKKEVFDAPVLGRINAAMGGIRVDRGTGSDEPLERAIAALRAGELVIVAPQGTIPRGPAFFEPELQGRWGAARLAHATRAPVIPLGVWGTERVWPRNQRLPNLLSTDPPLVTVRVGAPVELKYRSLNADTRRIMEAIVDLLPPEARERRTPTAEELARTYPPGYRGDPERESERRPGTDT